MPDWWRIPASGPPAAAVAAGSARTTPWPGSVGVALAVSLAPEGIVAECVDAHGDTVARAQEKISRPARPAQVAAALRAVVEKARRDTGLTLRLAVVSAADPVDRSTGRLVHLPDAPFLLGELDPARILAPHVDGPVTVDNDVNWAAQAERDHARAAALDDFTYLFLGEGLGCGIISDGRVRRGHAGLAGEIAHLITVGPRGQALPFIEVFSELGLRRTGSTAIDVGRLLAAATSPEPQAAATRHTLGQAISGVVAAVIALTDPELVIIGGSWGSSPVILETIAAWRGAPAQGRPRPGRRAHRQPVAGRRANRCAQPSSLRPSSPLPARTGTNR